jgi:hypothetical protein
MNAPASFSCGMCIEGGKILAAGVYFAAAMSRFQAFKISR